ncbi:hypothetical protein Tco_1453646, partial [Tanacetum coccineum]
MFKKNCIHSVIIMAQQQQAADVHQDELCLPNKRYDLMDANKKVDLENVQCPSESKILMNIIKNHPLRFSIAALAFCWDLQWNSRQSARLTLHVPVPSAEKVNEMILQDMIQVSLAKHKSREEQEARENVA